jgi:glycine cleavage system H protein
MSEVPRQLRYTKEHEWIRRESDGSAVVGITDHAQHALGELVFVELPDPGRAVIAGDTMAVVESTKAASDVYSPLTGAVLAANPALAGAPELVNSDPYGAGWLVRLQVEDPEELDDLMDAAAYAEFLEEVDA